MGNFSFPEKQIRDGFNVTFSLVRKSNQKVHRGLRPSGLPENGSKFRAWGLLIKPQVMWLSRIFTKICNLVQYSSEYFEPVRKGNFTAQGFVGIYKKARFDLVGQ